MDAFLGMVNVKYILSDVETKVSGTWFPDSDVRMGYDVPGPL